MLAAAAAAAAAASKRPQKHASRGHRCPLHPAVGLDGSTRQLIKAAYEAARASGAYDPGVCILALHFTSASRSSSSSITSTSSSRCLAGAAKLTPAALSADPNPFPIAQKFMP